MEHRDTPDGHANLSGETTVIPNIAVGRAAADVRARWHGNSNYSVKQARWAAGPMLAGRV